MEAAEPARRPNRRRCGGSPRCTMRSCATSRSRTATGGSRRRSPRRTGVGANWCTFATWASQAGRQHDPRRGRRGAAADTPRPPCRVPASDRSRSGAGCSGVVCWTRRAGSAASSPSSTRPFDALERASDAVARGNRRSSRRSGWSLPATCTTALRTRRTSRGAFLDSLAAGEPPDGQQLPPPGVPALSTPERRARCERTGPAAAHRQPRDRSPRADPPAARDPRGARRRLRRPGRPRATHPRRPPATRHASAASHARHRRGGRPGASPHEGSNATEPRSREASSRAR